jgi:uncharacterized membrane protein YkgB
MDIWRAIDMVKEPIAMTIHTLEEQFNAVDQAITRWMARTGIVLLRVSVGLIFLWFGALKLVPGLSPAESLIRASLPFLPLDAFIPSLGVWEMTIGLGFITGRFMRATILLMFLQMLGALSPIVLRPDRVFTFFPFGLTLEGQYIVKNVVLISAAIVVGSTVRGGGLTAEPGSPSSRE